MTHTYVLISGAWHGGWAWRPVAEHLRAQGHLVLTPTLPGLADGDDPTAHNLVDVSDFLVNLIDQHDLDDVTLVGHSWGGYPMTAAVPKLLARLREVVYWSAFVPTEGASLLDEVPPHYVELFTALAEASGTDSVTLPLEVWQQAFMQDATDAVQRLVHTLLVPQPMNYFRQPVDPVDFQAIGLPVRYLVSQEDVALPPGEYAWTPRFPDRLGVAPEFVPGSHEACFTQPKALAEALTRRSAETP
ncbi:alpha/beta fold hydrolase [Nitriliruptor alkaliphilus]|uniref:alpha/beta fold hydrolase n=1 Tax=Nitriliruptor alkaliphilus TaxID=427918 RepID=UPI000698C261|nr:alpha/beta fold hydrolase [Nitriliruptor alkaliphilus]